MACVSVDLGDGTAAITCGVRVPACQIPGCRGRSEAQCDFPVFKNGTWVTCDMHLCRRDRRKQAFRRGVDYCLAHDKRALQDRSEHRGLRERRFKLLHPAMVQAG